MTTSSVRVATDVGGTFTDFVTFAVDETTGQPVLRTAKSDTTPARLRARRAERHG